ncbi:helix-turn-helix domain-containing protein [Actinomadura kijaniata]|uniref:helix-turn-helix domain-containing protein n=1 Tax=Actinomadura kijaniata TaxID=46161 RepID=UPI00082B0922|nr:helix-turn-helix domain-containing protein [Actinomadura kijaniata]
MRLIAHERGDAAVWDVVRPARPSRVAGVTMAGFLRGAAPADHRVVPHAAVMLALDLGPAPLIVDDADGRRHRGGLVAGPGLGGAVRVRGENVECLHVRLTPVAARAVLGVDPADLGSAVVALDDLWGRQASRIRERLADTSSWEERFALAEALFVHRRAAGAPVEPEVAWAWQRIAASGGRVRVDRLAAELGWSRKRLWSRFHAQIGLPPKRAARLVRFDRAAHRLAEGRDPARVAADGGYTDQSHLHRDVVAFAGTTPAAMADESRRATAALTDPALTDPAGPQWISARPSWTMCTR